MGCSTSIVLKQRIYSRLICSASECVKCPVFTEFTFGSKAFLGALEDTSIICTWLPFYVLKLVYVSDKKWNPTSASPQSFWKTYPSFWTDYIFQNYFLWLIDRNSPVIILLFININNLHIGMIKHHVTIHFQSQRTKNMKFFTCFSSKKSEIWKFGGEGRENYCNNQYFCNWLLMQSSLTLHICWRHVQGDIYAVLHPTPVRSQISKRGQMNQASWLSILKLASVQSGTARTLC